tara:strand:+ start:1038 stop:1832 length:795 start_codon:yes stop_codon:yes gene_type:complete
MNNFLLKFNAFLERDLKIALSYKFNLLINVVFLAIFFTIIFLAFQDSSISSSGASYLNVFLSIISIDFMFSSLNVFSKEVRNAKILGTFESILLTNTSFFTIIFSSYALTFFRMFLRGALYLCICKYFFNLNIEFFDISFTLLSLFFNSVPFIGLGLISASFIVIFKMGEVTNILISLLSILFSGIFFPVSSLPIFMKSFVEVTPLNICLETSKIILSDSFSFSDLLPYFKVTCLEILLFLPLGIYFIFFAQKVAKKEGSLSFY